MSSFSLQIQEVKESTDIVRTLSENLAFGPSLLITSSGFSKRGICEQIVASQSQPVFVLDNVNSHPQVNALVDSLKLLKGCYFSNVIGLGGGSVIDFTKILAGSLQEPFTSVERMIQHTQPLKKPDAKVVVIPTTAGTGAEVTSFATLWDRQKNRKHSVLCNAPDMVVFDPGLTLTLPKEVTLYSALDAISHAMESLWNINRTVESEYLALQALEGLLNGLPAVMADANNLSARRQLQWAAYHAGAAISITKTAVAHAISYPLTLHYNVPHGLACSFTLRAIIEDLGNEELKISQVMADKLVKLFESLSLDKEMSKFGSWRDIFEGDKFYLDSARSGNFIKQVDTNWAKKIVMMSP